MSTKNTNRFNRDITNLNIIMTVLVVIANISVLFVLFNATKFSNLSGSTFITVNIITVILLIMMNVALMFGIRTKTKSIYFTGVFLAVVFLILGIYGAYAMGRINRNVEKITASTTEESVSTSLVVYSKGGSSMIKEINNLDGKTVGLATGTHTAELGKARIESENMTVSYSEYQDYSSEMLALLNGEIDCAILPTNYVNMFGNEVGMEEFLPDTSSILDFEETVTVENASGSDKDITKEPFTVLLIGSADGLSDTMILCSVNPISMKVTMSSLARDSYVPITCYGGNSSKLNAAHAVSRDCLIGTIENLVGVDIDYYVDTNFKGVVQVVDALGGIVVDSPLEFVGQNSDSERGAYTVWVPAGDDVLLNGEQALAFARERHLFATGDFARQEHQQEVIEAILRKIMRTRDINTLLNVMDAAGENIQTNLSLSQMTGFMSYALQKANRYYDQEHVEKVIQLQGSRVTGYSSGLWDDGLQMSLYIYRLWQGSLADTKKAIIRNTDMTSPIEQSASLQWSTNWDFYVPSISAEVYSEAQVPSTVPTTLGNYVGRSIGSLQSFCNAQGIALSISYVQDPSQADGIITSQSVAAGTPIDHISGISVTVVQNNGAATPTPQSSASEVTSKSACVALGYSWSSSLNKCFATAGEKQAAEDASKTPEPTEAPTPTPDQTPTPEPTPTEDTRSPEQKACEAAAGSGATWDGSQCHCGEGYTWNGSTCVAAPTPVPEPTEAPTPDPAPAPSEGGGDGTNPNVQNNGATTNLVDPEKIFLSFEIESESAL